MQRPNMNSLLWSMVIVTIFYMAKMKRVTIVMVFHTVNTLTINANNFRFIIFKRPKLKFHTEPSVSLRLYETNFPSQSPVSSHWSFQSQDGGRLTYKKDEGGRCKSGLVALSSSSFYGIEPNKYDWRYLTIIKAIINFVLFTLGIHNNWK